LLQQIFFCCTDNNGQTRKKNKSGVKNESFEKIKWLLRDEVSQGRLHGEVCLVEETDKESVKKEC